MKTLVKILNEAMNPSIEKVEVLNSMGDMYIVRVWTNYWHIITKHKFRADAEEVRQEIQAGKSSDEIKKLVEKQNQSSLSKWIADYWLHWN